MRTDDLIDALARQVEPVQPQRGGRALALALALGVPLALLGMVLLMGLNPQLREYLGMPMWWIKFGFGLVLAAIALVLALRLSRPGVRAGAARLAPIAPILALWLLAIVVLAAAPAAERSGLIFGSSWRVCPLNITVLSLPVLVGALIALRTMAPTQLAAAGAAAGLLAGGVGTAVYALHCPELAAPFLAIWYVLGALIPVAIGALVGPRVLRW
ncbi:MAG: DUF1109 domain-containing protein [Burkholderiaceae bacterium]|nr:DUF1109 domain-containing protein [Burkholderiaceae bacterium]